MMVLFTDRSLYRISVRLNSRRLPASFTVFSLIRQQEYLNQYKDQATSGRQENRIDAFILKGQAVKQMFKQAI